MYTKLHTRESGAPGLPLHEYEQAYGILYSCATCRHIRASSSCARVRALEHLVSPQSRRQRAAHQRLRLRILQLRQPHTQLLVLGGLIDKLLLPRAIDARMHALYIRLHYHSSQHSTCTRTRAHARDRRTRIHKTHGHASAHAHTQTHTHCTCTRTRIHEHTPTTHAHAHADAHIKSQTIRTCTHSDNNAV